MEFIQTYGKEIVALLVPVITWALKTHFKSKARLQIAQPHSFTFLVQEPLRNAEGQVVSQTQTVHTRSFMFQNSGREAATKIELVFNWKPMCINLWPSRHITDHVEHDGRYVVMVDNLSPGEVLGCEVLSVNQDLPGLVVARCEQSVGHPINMYPQPVVGRGVRFAAAILLAIGLATSVYLAILLVQFLVLRTPFGH